MITSPHLVIYDHNHSHRQSILAVSCTYLETKLDHINLQHRKYTDSKDLEHGIITIIQEKSQVTLGSITECTPS